MLHLLSRTLPSLVKKKAPGEGGPIGDMLLLAHQVPDLVQKRRPEAGLEKDPIALRALCLAVQSRTPIPLDLGLDLDPTHQLRKG